MRLFSVLFSLYHKESALFLRQSLESVFGQTLLPSDVILVEDGLLTDELYAVVQIFEHRDQEADVVGAWIDEFEGEVLNAFTVWKGAIKPLGRREV